MSAVLTDIAIQMKSSLSFLLGLGGMFSICKSGFTSLFGLPVLSSAQMSARSSLAVVVDGHRKRLIVVFSLTLLFFVAACWLYFGPLGGIDADALSKGKAVLSACQEHAVLAIVVIAAAIVTLDVYASVHRQRLSDLVKEA